MFVSNGVLKVLKKINREGDLQKNVDSKSLTSFKAGGAFRAILYVNTLESLIRVMIFIREKSVPYFILGKGSNILVSDKGYAGVCIVLGGDFADYEIRDDAIEFGAGISLSKAFRICRDLGLGGLEVLATIPGSIGGATYMNAGAFGQNMSDIVSYVVCLLNGKITYLKPNDCEFGYRHSVFQEKDIIILRVGLKKQPLDKIDMQNKYLHALETKKASQPLEYPSAGSVFKNIDGISVAKMLDDMGAKGLKQGDAMVSTKHSNFIINTGNATAQDIYVLIEKLRKAFFEKYRLQLQSEIKLIGEFNETDG